MTVDGFKEKSNIEIVEELMKMNNGYITSKMLAKFDIHRMYLTIMQKNNLIERVGSGIYLDKNKIEDPFYILNLEIPHIVFSHMTALYFHGLSIEKPNYKYNITVCNNYYNSNFKNHSVFYVSKDIYNMGLTETVTPFGNKVQVYDIERCICDIFRSKNRMDLDNAKYSLKTYLKRKDKDLVKLSEYAEALGVKDELFEILTWLL